MNWISPSPWSELFVCVFFLGLKTPNIQALYNGYNIQLLFHEILTYVFPCDLVHIREFHTVDHSDSNEI